MNPQTIQKQSFHMLTAIVVLACATTVGLVAQDPVPSKPDRTAPAVVEASDATAPEYTSTSRMIGADVLLAANAEQLDKAQKKGEEPKHAKATVSDWIVDSRTGALRYAVLSVGGFLGINDKTVLVPCEELVWNNSMERFSLGWTKEQLKARPEFDLKKACDTGLDAACATAHDPTKVVADGVSVTDDGKTVADASAKRTGRIDGTSFVYPTCRLCRASDLASMPVYTADTSFGKVQDLIVDRKRGAIVLAVVNHDSTLGLGGKDYLIPMSTFTPCVKEGDKKLLCSTARTKEQLETSTLFEKPKNGVVDPLAAKTALSGEPARFDSKTQGQRIGDEKRDGK